MIGRPLPRYHPKRSTRPGYDRPLSDRPTDGDNRTRHLNGGALSSPHCGGGDSDSDDELTLDSRSTRSSLPPQNVPPPQQQQQQQPGSPHSQSAAPAAVAEGASVEEEAEPASLESMEVPMRYTLGAWLDPDDLLVLGLTSAAW